MRIHKEGLATLTGLSVFILATGLFGWYFRLVPLLMMTGGVMILFIFALYFFRDPLRRPPDDVISLVSPADGKILEIEQVNEKEFFNGSVTRITIFLSLFDVHVNYSPFSGRVDHLEYKRGRYYPAQTERASRYNVSFFTGLESEYGKVAFRQITGLFARRIVNYLKYDQCVNTGQKIGMIKFGSRVEVYLSDRFECRVCKGEKVRAGESVIAAVVDPKNES